MIIKFKINHQVFSSLIALDSIFIEPCNYWLSPNFNQNIFYMNKNLLFYAKNKLEMWYNSGFISYNVRNKFELICSKSPHDFFLANKIGLKLY